MKKLLFISILSIVISCQDDITYKDLNGATWYDYKLCQGAIQDEIISHELQNKLNVENGKMKQEDADIDNIQYKAGLGKYAHNNSVKK